MAAITQGVGTGLGSVGVSRQDLGVSPQPTGHFGRGQQSDPGAGGDSVSVGSLGRLYEARGGDGAEAKRVRQLDRKLGRLADQIKDVKVKLEQVKLYPPYPPDESRRAEAIRQFNGIAAEVRRMETIVTSAPSLPALSASATTQEAEQAVTALGQTQSQFEAQRTELTQSVGATGETAAVARSVDIGAALKSSDGAGISRQGAELLRTIA